MVITIPLWGFTLIIGDDEEDVITGSGGIDIIRVKRGDDIVYAGGGNDLVFSGRGDDEIYGGGGNDILFGEQGDDTIYGEDGNDFISGGSGSDSLYGGNDNDILFGGGQGDAIYGDAGNDFIFGGAGADLIQGGAGNDLVFLQGGDDTAHYLIDDNIAAVDIYHGGSGFDTLVIDVSQAQLNASGITANDIEQYFIDNNANKFVDFSSLGFNLVATRFEAIEVNVIGVSNEAPTIELQNTITDLAENIDTSSRIKVADIVIIDDGVGTNNLSLAGADANLFEIDGNELFLKAGVSLDFESQAQLDVSVLVDDSTVGSSPDDAAALSIAVTDMNDAPIGVNDVLSASEDTPLTIAVVDLISNDTDADGDALLFSSIVSDPTYGVLVDNGDGTLTYTPNADFSGTDSFTYEVSDGNGGLSSATAVINVAPVNDAPTVSLDAPVTTLAENFDTSSRYKVADIVITDDALGTNVLSLSGADADLFELDGNELYLVAGASLDFESHPQLDVVVSVDDDELPGSPEDSVSLSIDITDVNESPTVSLDAPVTTLAEDFDTSNRYKVADIAITDDTLGTNVLSLSGADASLFELDGNELYLIAGANLDFESHPQLDVVVSVDDDELPGSPEDSVSLSIDITDVNESPTVSLDAPVTTLAEDFDTSNRYKVADIVITDDALGTNVLSLSGADADLFELDGNELYLIAGANLDFESHPQLDVVVSVDDGELPGSPEDSVSLSIGITDVNESPTVSLDTPVTTLAEDFDTSSRYKVADIVITDDALGTNVLSLSGADADLFELDGNELYLIAGASLDFESHPQLDVVVSVDDGELPGSPEDSVSLSIDITDVNESPTVSLDAPVTTLAEDFDTSSRYKVADIVITDDALGTNVLSLSGADADLFELDGNELYLVAGASLDFESHPQLDVVVSVDDDELPGSPEDSVSLSIDITDVNESPTVSLDAPVTTLAEDFDTSNRYKVADIAITDDTLGTNVLSLSGADASLFELDGNELYLIAGANLDFESHPQLDVVVSVDDDELPGSPEDSVSLSIDITDVNESPTVSLDAPVTTLAEDFDTSNRYKVADIVITDDALGTNVLSLSGADADLFELDGNELYLIAGANLDFESHPQLDVVVSVDDGELPGSPEDSVSLSIGITDVNESPTVSLDTPVTTLAEDFDTSSRYKVADIVITDDALGTNVLSLSGADADLFELDGNELYLIAGASLDFESHPQLDVVVSVDDGELPGSPEDSVSLSIDITDVNESPTVSLDAPVTTLAEDFDTSNRYKVADIVITDDALGTNVLSLSGADADLFELDGNELYLVAGASLDFESHPQLDVVVSVDDTELSGSPEDSVSLSIGITDVNESPTVSLDTPVMTLAEDFDTSNRYKVADIVIADDALGTNVLSLSGADADLFELDGNELYLVAGASLDFESHPQLDVVVSVDDDELMGSPEDSVSLSIAITNVNEAPVGVDDYLTTAEDTPLYINASSLRLNDTDADGDILQVTSTSDPAHGTLTGSVGYVLTYTPDADFSGTDSFTYTVSDGNGGFSDATVYIDVTPVNDAPTVSLDAPVTTLAENFDTSSRYKVADIVITDDALGNNVLSLSGADADLFELDGNELYLVAGASLDFESHPQLDVVVSVDDTELSGSPEDSVSLSIGITDVNESPTVSLDTPVMTLAEDFDTSNRYKVADIVIADDALGTNVLSLSGADADLFELDGNELYLIAGANLDFESHPQLDVVVSVDDGELPGSPEDSVSLSIAITDVNEAPTVSLDAPVTTLAEDFDTSNRYKVADIVITDDALGTNVLSLSGADADLFELDGNELYLIAGASLDFESHPQLDVVVSVDDGELPGSPEDSVSLSIAITDVNESPTVSLDTPVTTLAEDFDTSNRYKVADIVITDDALGTNVFSLSGADADLFELDGNELYLVAGASLDFESHPQLDVVVSVDDGELPGSPEDSVSLSIGITDVNESPKVSLDTPVTTLAEDFDTSSRYKVADIVITDDALGNNVLSLSGADADLFELDGNELYLVAGASLDFESYPQLDVVVSVDDGELPGSPEDSVSLSIGITDVNEEPKVSLDTPVTTLAEDFDTSSRYKVADIVITDDALGTNVLSLSGADADLFELDGNELYLVAGASLDFESHPQLDVVVLVDDASLPGSPEDSVSLSINITNVNEAPVGVDDYLTTAEDTPLYINASSLRLNDTDADGDILQVTSTSNPAHGTLTGSVGYVLTYTPDADFSGTDSFTYTVSDGNGGFSDATVYIDVTPVNDAPTVSLANPVTTLVENFDTSSRYKVADIVITDDALGVNNLSLSGADADLFELDGNELYLIAGASLDFESHPQLDVVVSVDDTTVGVSPDDSVSLSIGLTDANDAPTVLLVDPVTTLAEDFDTSSRYKVADIVIADDALGTNVLSLSGADANLFELDGNELYLVAGASLDFESHPQLDVVVSVDDVSLPSSPEDSVSLSIGITDVNESPKVSLDTPVTTLAEDFDTSNRYKVADIVIADDALGTNVLSLSGTDANLFELDGNELYLVAGASLDFESHPQLDVVVSVDDVSLPGSPEDSVSLSIGITDVNESPKVSLDTPVTTLAEDFDTSNRYKVADIVITDDALGNNVLSLSGADADLFELDGNELYLVAGVSLDFESHPQLDVVVSVDDASLPGSPEDSVSLSIGITDVNESPKVSLDTPVTTLAEDFDTSSRYKVADIVIADDALGVNNLSLSGTDADLFELDGNELYLVAGATLDFESHPQLEVVVSVDDVSLPGSPDDSVSLSIDITDVNESPTVSLDAPVTTLAEDFDTSNRYKVADIVITDDTLGTNVLSLSGADADLFELDGNELYLVAGASLDFESHPQLDVVVSVDDDELPGSPDDSVSLSIDITNVNEAPVGVDDFLTTVEDTPLYINASSLRLNDTDADGDILQVTSTSDPAHGTLTGSVGYVLTYTPDADFSGTDSFTYTVSDGNGGFSDATVYIDVTPVNDVPVGVDDVLSAEEDTPLTIAVADLVSNDTDVDGDVLLFSTIVEEPTYGALVNNGDGTLTYTPNANFNGSDSFTYEVSDGHGGFSVATAVINVSPVNDAPLLADTIVAIAENTADATLVLDVNDANTGLDSDLDGDAISYALTGGNESGAFAIDAVSGVITVADASQLDYESVQQFVLEVTATAGGASDTAQVTVNLTPENDNAPLLTTTSFSVAENVLSAGVVLASDADVPLDDLTYSISGGADASRFSLDANSGALSFVSAPDYEAPSDFDGDNIYELEITVSDGVHATTSAVTVSVTNADDNAPLLSDAVVSIEENTLDTTLVLDINDANTGIDFDLDGDAISYALTGGNESGAFAIDAVSGAITVADASQLDYESVQQFVLEVTATAGGASDTAQVTVNLTPENDNAPLLTTTSFSVAENVISVGDVLASDADVPADDLIYSISGGADASKFSLDANSGALSFVSAPDYEAPSDFDGDNIYELEITVSDGVHATTSAVTVNVTNADDNVPLLADAIVAIAENTADATLVWDVNDANTGLDLDGDGDAISYTLTGGNESGAFTIDAVSGAITVADASQLDYESTQQFVLTVTATAGGASDTAQVTVNLTPENDNAPVLTTTSFSVAENALSVGDVLASDADVPADYALTYSISGGADASRFSLDTNSGALSFINAPDYEIPGDFDGDNIYELEITVSDGVHATSSAVTVSVTDVNEAPIDLSLSGDIVDEQAADGTVIGIVTATDPDTNDTALYTLVDDAGGRFAIDALSGELTVADGTLLNYESASSHDITVRVTDSANNSYDETFTVTLIDVIEFGELGDLDGSNGLVINGASAGDYAGYSVSTAGDFNGDGFEDVIIGAYKANSYTGESYIVYGGTNLAASIELADLSGIDGVVFSGIATSDSSGHSVSNAGDINGDGIGDVIIGAYSADPNGNSSAGASYVVFGDTNYSGSLNLADLDGNNGFKLEGLASLDYTGYSVSTAGDINGDGIDDVIIGAYSADPNGISDAGASYVVFGDTNFSASLDLSSLDGSNGFVINGVDFFDYSGRSVSAAGDVNGDGYEDIIVGAPVAAPNGVSFTGESYVVFGGENFSASLDLSSLDGSNGFRLDGIDPNDYSGYSVSTAGDVNGDGYDDVIVGAYKADSNTGESYVVFGDANFSGSLNLSSLDGSNGFRIVGIDSNDYSGFSVSTAGDVNGDGYDDIIIGAYLADPNGNLSAGESYVVYGGANFTSSLDLSNLNVTDGFILKGVDSGDYAGYSVSAAGDVNGDGFDDLIIGAYAADPNGNSAAGTSYIVYGGDYLSEASFIGTAAADALVGSASDEILIGAQGDDTLTGGGGQDTLIGGEGNDTIVLADADFFRIDGGTGIDTLLITNGNLLNLVDTLDADGDGNVLEPSAAALRIENIERIVFDDNSYSFVMPAGSSSIAELDGSSLSAGHVLTVNASSYGVGLQITGGAGNDNLTGGSGDDIIIGGDGADNMNGGAGFDLVSYETLSREVAVLLSTGNAFSSGTVDTLTNFEGVIGSGFADELIGDDNANLLQGGAGDDTLYGGAGNDELSGGAGDDYIEGDVGADTIDGGADIDTLDYQSSSAAVNVDLVNQQGSGGYAEGDIIRDVEIVIGSNFNDTIIGDAADNTLQGGSGIDTISGGAGDDMLDGGAGGDVLDGGSGIDTLTYQDSVSGVYVDLNEVGTPQTSTTIQLTRAEYDLSGTNPVELPDFDTLTPISVETVEVAEVGINSTSFAGHALQYTGFFYVDYGGEFYTFNLTSDDGSELLIDDELVIDNDGLHGSQTVSEAIKLSEGYHKFELNYFDAGGAAILDVSATANVTPSIEDLFLVNSNSYSAGDQISNVENLVGSEYDDALIGNAADNVIEGGGGGDLMDGGDGIDTVSYQNASGSVYVNLNQEKQTDNLIIDRARYDLTDTNPQSLPDFDTLTPVETSKIPSADIDIIGSDSADYYALQYTSLIYIDQSGNYYFNLASDDGSQLFIDGELVVDNDGLHAVQDRSGTAYLEEGLHTFELNYFEATGNEFLEFTYSSEFDSSPFVQFLFNPGVVHDADSVGDYILNFENIIGSDFDDTLVGDDLANVIDGGAGNDVIVSGAGDDTVIGGAGDDIIDSGAGNNTVAGGAGNDIIDSGAGNDIITGDAGNDIIDSGAGDDVITGGVGNDTIDGQLGNDTVVYSGNSIDYSFVITSATQIQITDTNLADGDEGTDLLNNIEIIQFADVTGEVFGQNLFTGSADTFDFDNSAVNSVFFNPSSLQNALAGDDVVILPSLADPRRWSELNYDEEDRFYAGEGNDTITGRDRNDVIYGDSGNDIIEGGAGNDLIAGGSGNDTAVYSGNFADYTITQNGNFIQITDNNLTDGNDGSDTLREIENLQFADVTRTFSSESLFTDNADIIDFDNDNINQLFINPLITIRDALAGDDVVTLPSLSDPRGWVAFGYDDSVAFLGGSGNDTITGQDRDDIIEGGAGSDTLDGGAGVNTLSYKWSVAGVNIDLLNNTTSGGDAQGDSISNFTHVIGSAFSDNLQGDDQNNNLQGGLGNDTLQGGLGDDTLQGGAGDDVLDGQLGDDTAVYDGNLNDYIVTVISPTQIQITDVNLADGDEGTDTLNNVENLQFADTSGVLFGEDLFTDNADTLDFDNSSILPLFANPLLLQDALAGDDVVTLPSIVDPLNWSAFGYTDTQAFYGGAGNDTITGQDRDDIIDGGADDDYLFGGDGNDTLIGGDGNDTMLGALGNDTITGGLGNDKLLGSYGNDTLIGGEGDDTIQGGLDNDIITGGLGDDTLQGEAGDDTFIYTAGDSSGFAESIDGGVGYDTLAITYDVEVQYLVRESDAVIFVDGIVINDDSIEKIALNSASADSRFTLAPTGEIAFVEYTVDFDLPNDSSYIFANYSILFGDDFDFQNVAVLDITLDEDENQDRLITNGQDLIVKEVENIDIVDTRAASSDDEVRLEATLQPSSPVGSINLGDGTDELIIPVIYTSGSGTAEVVLNYAVNEVVRTPTTADTNTFDTYDVGLSDIEVFRVEGDINETEVVRVILDSADNVFNVNESLVLTDIANVELYGAEGNDTLIGGALDEVFSGGAGSDILDGGAGVNTLSYATSSAGVTIDLLNSTASGGDAQGDTISNFTHIIGSAFADNLQGDDQNNNLQGGAGDDVLDGQLGDDTAVYDGNLNDYIVTVISPTQIQITDVNLADGDEGTDTLNNVENLQFADTSGVLFAEDLFTDNADTLDFDNSSILPLFANPLLLQDALAGDDVVTLPSIADPLNWSAFGYTDTQAFYGGAGNDTITGQDRDDIIDGGAGNDNLAGGAGNDTLIGGLGNDTLQGEAGDDTFIYTVGDSTGLTETIDGGEGYDTLVLNEQGSANGFFSFDVMGSYNILVGGDELDPVSVEKLTLVGDAASSSERFEIAFDANSGVVNFNLPANTSSIDFGSLPDYDFEFINIDIFNIDLDNNDTQDVIITDGQVLDVTGVETVDVIDTTASGDVNDSVRLDTGLAGLAVTGLIDLGAGTDELQFTSIDVSAGMGTLEVDIALDYGSDTLSLTEVGVPANSLTYNADLSDIEIFTIEGRSFQTENLYLMLGDTDDVFDWNSVSFNQASLNLVSIESIPFVSGGGGADTIIGDSGDNIIEGGAGSDILDGGAGVDTLSYATSSAGVNIDLLNNTTSGGDAQGDTFSNFTHVIGSAFADNLQGDDQNNRLQGGAGNDILTGGLGDDTLQGEAGDDTFIYTVGDSSGTGFAETIDGGAGYDTLVLNEQGSANGLFSFDSMGSNNIIVGNDELDPVNVEKLVLVGDAASSNERFEIAFVGDSGVVNFNLPANTSSIDFGSSPDYDFEFINIDIFNIDLDNNDTQDVIITDGQVLDVTGVETVDVIDTTGSGDVNDSVRLDTGLAGLAVTGLIDLGAGTDELQFTSIDVSAGMGSLEVDIVLDYGSDTLSLTEVGMPSNSLTYNAVLSDIEIFTIDGRSIQTENLYFMLSDTGDVLDLSAATLSSIEFVSVSGGAGNDTIIGNDIDIIIDGGEGDDTIAGGAGNDTLNGGAGNDTVVYSGDSLGYSITTISANQFQVTDTNLADGDDGTDLLTDIEILQFSDVGVAMPIVLDLANDGVSFISLADSQVMYDVDGDGQLESTAWVGADDALLAYDANLDGSVSGRAEISFVDYVADADTDLEGLRYFDSNADGLLDASDAQFDQFYVWQDANSNGVSEQGELMTLTEAGIASIALTSDGVTYAQQDVFVYGTGEYTLTDGSKGQFADSGFVYQEQVELDLTQLAALSADEDSFVFTPSSGAVTLSDFDAVDGSQKIDLSILDTDFATLLANNAVSQVGADAVINLSGVGAESGDQITLQGVHVADLDASDFVF
jgi:Ca2+-binding RTX toxin-like protein/acid phosphatase family membrane protein YuiD